MLSSKYKEITFPRESVFVLSRISLEQFCQKKSVVKSRGFRKKIQSVGWSCSRVDYGSLKPSSHNDHFNKIKYLGHHIELAGTKNVTEYKMLMPYQQILRKNFSPGNEENIKKKMMTTHSQFLSKQNLVKSLSLSTECKQP